LLKFCKDLNYFWQLTINCYLFTYPGQLT